MLKLGLFVLHLHVEVTPMRLESGRELSFFSCAVLVSAVLPGMFLYPRFLVLPSQLGLQGCFRQGLYNSFALLHTAYITSDSFLYLT